jgi:pyruvate ferredoxin oxidoreductase alpha subunit
MQHDDFERTAESPAVSSARIATPARLEMLDVSSAIATAEKLTGSKIISDAAALGEAVAIAEKGERATLVAPVEAYAKIRDGLRKVATARLAIVAHAISGHGAEDLVALTDLGWGVLAASGPEDSFDLTLVARRAAEDSGVPFLVVHGLGRDNHPAGKAVAMVGVPQDKAIQAFVGPLGRRPSILPSGGGSSVVTGGDRAFAERVPFALGAALRDYGNVSGRRHDVFDKIPLGESPLVLVGMGPVGDALFCATTELRARGYDVGAIHITSLRPFPGPRLVKALARALAITVLEPADEPLAHGALLARDVKSAFTDALTWVPGFPGIGRIPKLFVGASGSAFDVADLAAVCENMLADERGRRVFSFTDVDHALPHAHPAPQASSSSPEARAADREISLRFVLDDVASAEAVLGVVGAALVSGVGLRTHGIITNSVAGAPPVLDIVSSRDHARGGMARRPPRLVVATERGVTSAGAVSALAEGAVLGVVGAEPTGILPEAARTVVRERRARVLPLATGGGGGADGGTSEATQAAIAGAALAVASRVLKSPLDGAAAARIVMEAMPGPNAEIAGQRARRSFEAMRDALVLATTSKDLPDPNRPIGVA